MDFSRFETKRVLRHRESVYEEEDIRNIFEALKEHELLFTMHMHGASPWKDCCVLDVQEDGATVFSRKKRVKDFAHYTEVLSVEVEANIDFVAEYDGAGRWAHLM